VAGAGVILENLYIKIPSESTLNNESLVITHEE